MKVVDNRRQVDSLVNQRLPKQSGLLLLQRVYSRHALHNIVSVVHYADPNGQPMLAVRMTKGQPNQFDLFVYQCDSEVRLVH